MFAFKTPTGIPHGTINLKSLRSYNPSWSGGASGAVALAGGIWDSTYADAHAQSCRASGIAPTALRNCRHLHLLCAGLAEFGSEQLEFIKLSDWTGNATCARLVEGNVALMHDKYPDRVRT